MHLSVELPWHRLEETNTLRSTFWSGQTPSIIRTLNIDTYNKSLNDNFNQHLTPTKPKHFVLAKFSIVPLEGWHRFLQSVYLAVNLLKFYLKKQSELPSSAEWRLHNEGTDTACYEFRIYGAAQDIETTTKHALLTQTLPGQWYTRTEVSSQQHYSTSTFGCK